MQGNLHTGKIRGEQKLENSQEADGNWRKGKERCRTKKVQASQGSNSEEKIPPKTAQPKVRFPRHKRILKTCLFPLFHCRLVFSFETFGKAPTLAHYPSCHFVDICRTYFSDCNYPCLSVISEYFLQEV